MQNYKLKQKILKTKPVTYYRATNSTSSSQTYVIKKLNKPHTWQQILQSKSLTLCKNSKCKYIAKIKQIIKQENSFYCIMQNSEINLTEVIKNDIQRKDIFRISKQLVEMMNALKQENIMIRDIRPAHLMLGQNKNGVKLYHFQTFTEKDLTQLDLTELQDMRYLAPEQVLTKRKHYDQRSMVFSMGLIICELILGQPLLLNAKNKLQYIYQLTYLFPSDRMDKMQGSEHDFKDLTNAQSISQRKRMTFQQKMHANSQMSPAFIALLQKMLKVDYTQRIHVSDITTEYQRVMQEEQNWSKRKHQDKIQNNHTSKPNKNQVDLQKQMVTEEIQFDFQNRPTFSIVPAIFTQKQKGSKVIPMEENVEDDGVQPIIIKQASGNRGSIGINNMQLKKGVIHKGNNGALGNYMSGKIKGPISNLYSNQSPSNQYGSTNPVTQFAPISMNPSNMYPPMNMHPSSHLNPSNQLLKNSRATTKQTTLHTIKKPQLTNYALNQVGLGLKMGMSNTLFTDGEDGMGV